MMLRLKLFLLVFLLVAGDVPPVVAQSAATRDSRGLVALYDFSERSGTTVHDRSGVGQAVDLTIDKAPNVSWSDDGLTVKDSTKIVYAKPARKIIDAVRRSNAITVEAWLKPAKTSQSGPARIVSISQDTSGRNVTL